jgi:hypothetical protein
MNAVWFVETFAFFPYYSSLQHRLTNKNYRADENDLHFKTDGVKRYTYTHTWCDPVGPFAVQRRIIYLFPPHSLSKVSKLLASNLAEDY